MSEQNSYPPNYFIFDDITEGSLTHFIKSSTYILGEELVYPSFFSSYLNAEKEPMGISIYESIKKAFEVEKDLKNAIISLIKRKDEEKASELLTKCWLFFVRSGVQGLLYWIDTYRNELFSRV